MKTWNSTWQYNTQAATQHSYDVTHNFYRKYDFLWIAFMNVQQCDCVQTHITDMIWAIFSSQSDKAAQALLSHSALLGQQLLWRWSVLFFGFSSSSFSRSPAVQTLTASLTTRSVRSGRTTSSQLSWMFWPWTSVLRCARMSSLVCLSPILEQRATRSETLVCFSPPVSREDHVRIAQQAQARVNACAASSTRVRSTRETLSASSLLVMSTSARETASLKKCVRFDINNNNDPHHKSEWKKSSSPWR